MLTIVVMVDASISKIASITVGRAGQNVNLLRSVSTGSVFTPIAVIVGPKEEVAETPKNV